MNFHNRLISDWVWENGHTALIPVVDFTLATIQQQFHTVPQILREWRELKLDAPTMFSFKKEGYQHVRHNSARLFTLLRHAINNEDPVDAIDTLLEIPGLGTVKAGFVAQLLGFEVGCIDGQNATLYDVDVSEFVIRDGMKASTRLRKIRSYVQLCEELGGSRVLWDNWCELIGQKYSSFDDWQSVSALHTECIIDIAAS